MIKTMQEQLFMEQGLRLKFISQVANLFKTDINSLQKSLYIKTGKIGEGNYAQVFLGQEKETNDIVAIKSVRKPLLRESSRNITAMICEINSMRGLRHPNICGLFGIFEDQNYVHLIIEYCTGGELFKRIIKRRKFNEFNAARLTQNMLSSLAYLHEVANVVHRDIKPENIMMLSNDNDYEIKLADFGLAQKFDCTQKLGLRCGSPGYVAPEILKGDGYGPKCDIFSLVGRQPFYGKNPQEVLLQNKECKINFQAKY